MIILQEDFTKGEQSLYYKRIQKHVSGYDSNYKEVTNKIFVDIKRDSYDSQCYWRVFVWRNEWKLVTQLGIDKAKSLEISPYQQEPDITPFRNDADTLTRLALQILE